MKVNYCKSQWQCLVWLILIPIHQSNFICYSSFATEVSLDSSLDSMSESDGNEPVDVLFDSDKEDDPKSIFDCQYVMKYQSKNTWKCLHCDGKYQQINATKAVNHLVAVPGVNHGVPKCKQRNRANPITPELQRLYNRFLARMKHKKATATYGKRRSSVFLNDAMDAVAATLSQTSKKSRLKTPPSASSLSSSAWRPGAVKPRHFGSSIDSHFKTTDSRHSRVQLTKPAAVVRGIQLKMTDCSSNPQGEKDLTVAIAQLIHLGGLSFSLVDKQLFRRVLMLAKAVPTSYRPPSRNQVSGKLLELLHDQLMQRQYEELLKDVDLFKLQFYLDGATIKTVPFLNVMCSGAHNHKAVLDLIDCTDHMAEGGQKDATYIAREMETHIEALDPKNAVLFDFDGASNVQKAGMMLEASYPWATTTHASEHVCALMFTDWFQTVELDLLKLAVMKIQGNFGGSKHGLGALLKKHSKNHNSGRFIGLLRAVEPRMAGHAIAFLRLLRLRPVIEAILADPVYKLAKPPTALTELLKNNAFWHALYVVCRAFFPALRLLRLCDMQVAAMDKLHYFTIKCQEQFAHQDRIDELNTAAWNASPQTTEMYKWIHMYFCSDDKKTVPFDSEEAPPSMQVRVLKCDEDDSDSDDDEDDGSVVEEDDVVQDNMKDILACRTERSYSLSERFRKVFEKRSRLLMHPFATAAWLCSPVPQVQETWTRMDESDKGIVNDLIVKLLVPKCRTQVEADELGDDMKNSFWDEWEQFSSRTGCYEERYKWASHDITNNRSHFWHKKHSIHCTQVLGRLACIVTSKICGIGNAE